MEEGMARKWLERWLRGVDLNHRPLGYESRGKLQIQLLCGADDNPRGSMNTGG